MFTAARTSRSTRTTAAGLAAAFILLLSACGAASEEAAGDTDQAPTSSTVVETPADDTTTDDASDADSAADDDATTDTADDEGSNQTQVNTDQDDDNAGNSDSANNAADDDDEEWGAENNCNVGQLDDSHAQYVVGNIPDDDPDGGLVVRLLPGADGPRSTVLPAGTDVTVDSDLGGNICVVIGSSVWWHIGPSPELAVGGWINSAYVYDISGETDEGIGDEENAGQGEDDFDIELAQIECIYNGSDQACDLLTTFVAGPEDNYGLGNSYSMAPSEFLASDCLIEFDQIACAELRTRDVGGDINTIANSFVSAYQSGDLAGQQALSGPRQNEFNNSGPIENIDPDVTAGVASVFADGNEFSWTLAPTIAGRCIVTDGLVQGCSVFGD